jgi:hypothetical protein
MGGACGKYWWETHTEFWRGNPKERDHLEDLCVHTRLLLKRMFDEQERDGVGWTHLADGKSKRSILACCLRLKTHHGLIEDHSHAGLFLPTSVKLSCGQQLHYLR